MIVKYFKFDMYSIKKHIFIPYFLLFLIGLIWLDQTPVVNYDEFWIADAAKNISESKGIKVGIYPELYRNVKVNLFLGFSLVQSLFIKVFGFNLFAIRLYSYIAIFISGFVFFLMFKRWNHIFSYLMPFAFVLNPYVWHIGHVGRPESVLLLLVVLTLYFLSKGNLSKLDTIGLALISFWAYFTNITGLCLASFTLFYLLYSKYQLKNTTYIGIYFLTTLFGILIYFSIFSIQNLVYTLSGNKFGAGNLFGDFKTVFAFYKYHYFVSKISLPTIIFLILTIIVNFNQKNINNKNTVFIFFFYFLFSICFFLFLRRTNPYYLVLSNIAILSIFLILLNKNLLSYMLIYTYLFFSIVFVSYYTYYFPNKETLKLKYSISESKTLFAPVHFRNQFLKHDNFIALEDYKNILKLEYIPFDDYARKYNIDIIIIDDFTANQWYAKEILEFVEKKSKLKIKYNHTTLGYTKYEDFPYYFSTSDLIDMKRYTSSFTIYQF